MSVAQLPASTVKLITSSQIITSVSSAVKELVENSLDSGATSIEVKLVKHGLDRIEVKDNGSGISKSNTECMALPHYTSKISDFSDLESLETYGFRGEALNALCRVGQVTVTTATSSDPTAMVYTLDSCGNIIESKPSHHLQGTTVVVSNLFKNLPVRRQLMGSNRRAQEELKLVETVVKSLAVIKPSIRVTLSHNKCQIWQKTPCASLQNSFSQLIGYSVCQKLEQLCFRINSDVSVSALVPKKDCDVSMVAKSTPALSLVFINQRPVTHKKILKILHQQLCERFANEFSTKKFAICLFSIICSPSSIDVNLEPNKTKVLLKDEDDVLNEIEKQLSVYYSLPCLREQNCVIVQEPLNHPLQQHKSLADADVGCPSKKRKLENGSSSFENDKINQMDHENVVQSTELQIRSDSCYEINSVSEGESRNSSIPGLQPNEHESRRLSSNEGSETLFQNFSTVSNTKYENAIPNQAVETHNSIFSHRNQSLKNSVSVSDNTEENEKTVSTMRSFFDNPEFMEETQQSDGPRDCRENSPKRSESNHFNEQIIEETNSGDLEHLWDHVDANDINDLSVCLEALESKPMSPISLPNENLNNVPKESVPFSAEEWSMGHVHAPQGDLVKGSCVFVGSKQSCASLNQNKATVADSNCEGHILSTRPRTPDLLKPSIDESENILEGAKRSLFSPQKSPSKSPPKKNRPVSYNDKSPSFDSSLQSVSSQMGRRELSAFTKFAREVRPQIILENPGIAFTHVSAQLAEKWQSLSTDERERYEEIARETATSKKVWKSTEKQPKLDWVKRLPEKEEKRKIVPSGLRHFKKFTRKESPYKIGIDILKANDQLRSNRQQVFLNSSKVHLIGQLEPSGTWICVEKEQLCVLNHSRLQEVVINHRLLNTYALALKPMPSREKLNPDILGEEAWITLMSLPSIQDCLGASRALTADVITKNGFKIEICDDNKTAYMTEIAEVLNYYGVNELKETLQLCRRSETIDLLSCRPLRVVSHIKSEAMRICRKSPSILNRTMVEELLEYWRTQMSPEVVNCLHSKKIITPLFNLANRTFQFS